MNEWVIKNHILEYFDDTHTYLVDGVVVPSITQIMNIKFGSKYKDVDKKVLENAANRGTAVHEAIEKYCKTGELDDKKETRNFRFLQKQYKFEVVENEIPVILFKNDEPICAGRLDLVLKMNGEIGGGDIKRTSTLDKEYLAYQLNLYRIGYKQCYDIEWTFLRGLHLRDNTRRFVPIPINEEKAWGLIEEYLETKGNNNE